MSDHETPPYQFIYFDTNIICLLASDRSTWPRLISFLNKNDYVMGICEAQLVELYDAKNLHDDLAELLISVPTGMMKRYDVIIAEEVQAHPFKRAGSLSHLPYLINKIPTLERKELIKAFLSDKSVATSRRKQLEGAVEMPDRLPKLKENFPPANNGKYSRDQVNEFAFVITLQWLVRDHRDFLEQHQKDITSLHPEVFLTSQLYAHVIFYKYYLGRHKPRKSSDFGDLFHLLWIPYCRIAVVERGICEILKQIKRNHNILETTEIHNVDFIQEYLV